MFARFGAWVERLVIGWVDAAWRREALKRIRLERMRQVHVEGFDAWHDDRHSAGELLAAARCYAAPWVGGEADESSPHSGAARHPSPSGGEVTVYGAGVFVSGLPSLDNVLRFASSPLPRAGEGGASAPGEGLADGRGRYRALPPAGWPWDPERFKPRGIVRDLERAGALCLAEMAREERAGVGLADVMVGGEIVVSAAPLLEQIVARLGLALQEQLARDEEAGR